MLLYKDLCLLIASYALMKMVKYKKFIIPHKIDQLSLQANPGAIPLLKNKCQLTTMSFKNPKLFEMITRPIPITEILIKLLSSNPSAIHLLEQNLDIVEWRMLSKNPAAVHILKNNMSKICYKSLALNPNPEALDILLERDPKYWNWGNLSANPAAIKILEQNMEKINWNSLSKNSAAIHLLEKNFVKINWYNLSKNPGAIHLLEKNPSRIDWFNISMNSSIVEEDIETNKRSIKKLSGLIGDNINI